MLLDKDKMMFVYYWILDAGLYFLVYDLFLSSNLSIISLTFRSLSYFNRYSKVFPFHDLYGFKGIHVSISKK